ncbi:histidine phosphotransferase family protein [Arenibaculum pallidiluteum]|uniref:histidine phosphotransferase family protein n=1 Tax=Arenibaculum pallidiluteum TaxID=2812559 RepID=UPI002E2B61E4|nr:histidine phosphotransferase family protein [Arenibaculum pallidiluteum]
MTVALDIRVLELLCSRLCHELVSPVGAVNNGVELIEEMGADMADEAMGLIAHSAQQAARRLQVLRLAYGAAGTDASSFGEVRTAAANYLSGSKIALEWPAGVLDDALAGHRGFAKVLLNLIIMGEDALAYGGTLALVGSGGTVTVSARGRAAALKPDIRTAFDGACAPGDLSPRTVHAYATGRFAENYGLSIAPSETPDRLDLQLSIAA